MLCLYIVYSKLLLIGMARKQKGRGVFDLSPQDEHKVLLLATGLVFGMALASFIFRIYSYVGLASVAIGLVLVLIEKREEKLRNWK